MRSSWSISVTPSSARWEISSRNNALAGAANHVKPTVAIAIAFITAVVGFVVYSTFHSARYRCEVCLAFNGRRECRIAGAETREHAQRTATDNICTELAAGVTQFTLCEQTRPDS